MYKLCTNFAFYLSDIDECSVNRCKNGGTCENRPGSFICRCPSGWTGDHCEIGENFCLVEINPVVLRKAKIVYNFGLSESNRVKYSVALWNIR